MILYHGTSKESADIIKANGFKAFECSDFGEAVYFSDLPEWALDYGVELIKAELKGEILDFSTPEHWQIYKNFGIPKKYTAIKDGHIIAVFNPKNIKIIN